MTHDDRQPDAAGVEVATEERESESADRARSYDADVRAAVPGYEVLHETVAAILTNELGNEASVLVVGAGTGEEVMRLAQGNPGWRFTAEDPAGAMLVVAREKLAAAGVADRVELFEGLVQDLPRTERYDAATLILVHHFLPDDGAKLDMLQAIAARLNPGAPLVISSMHGDLAARATERLYQAWRQRQIANGMATSDAAAMFQGLPEVVRFVPESRIVELLRQASFGDVEPIFKAFVIGGWLARRSAGDS